MGNKPIIHYPRLDTVLMVEDALRKAEEYPSKRQLWLSLEKKLKKAQRQLSKKKKGSVKWNKVLGVSVDDPHSHKKFEEKYKLNSTL